MNSPSSSSTKAPAKSHNPPVAPGKKERQAAALKANLKRRKAASK